ncbi:uncharacterized protein B0T23DRAFT_446697 [Neurospora hispaniola]|uniref:Uncharacterized protein n=1 Tax=Neurospora hispaniola TaxID=588809 RepID=A0AAJ0I267_9PEZI|nr:hypothetical protein B0T23DRAFT_446697 [Neurospora hispaniola]
MDDQVYSFIHGVGTAAGRVGVHRCLDHAEGGGTATTTAVAGRKGSNRYLGRAADAAANTSSAGPLIFALALFRALSTGSCPFLLDFNGGIQYQFQSQLQISKLKIHATLEDIKVQLHIMLGMINSMSRNIRREVITRHEEVRDLLIRNRNGNCDENEDDNNNNHHNHNDKGKGADNGNCSGHRDGFHHGLPPSASPGPGSLHPSPRIPDEVRATDAMMYPGISSEQTGVSVRYISLACSIQELSAIIGRH